MAVFNHNRCLCVCGSANRGGVSFQDGVHLPQCKEMLLGQQASLTPRSVEHRACMALEEGGGKDPFTAVYSRGQSSLTFERTNLSLETCFGSSTE